MVVLVIGAGACGLTAIKACKEEYLDVICWEKDESFGGLWRYRDCGSSVMRTTLSNTSKEMSAFSDFPPEAHFPSYMPHQLVVEYLEQYAKHFNLLECIVYNMEVLEVSPSENYDATGQWSVKAINRHTNEVTEQIFNEVLVCTGHHSQPYIPSYPDMSLYSGVTMHSQNYKTFTGLEDKRVLVVGIGNSGGDIASEASNVAKEVFLSTRRGAWIYPRLLKKGKPLDVTFRRRFLLTLPTNLVNNKIEKTLNKRMDHNRYGIKPQHPAVKQHPTINDDLPSRLLSGSIKV